MTDQVAPFWQFADSDDPAYQRASGLLRRAVTDLDDEPPVPGVLRFPASYAPGQIRDAVRSYLFDADRGNGPPRASADPVLASMVLDLLEEKLASLTGQAGRGEASANEQVPLSLPRREGKPPFPPALPQLIERAKVLVTLRPALISAIAQRGDQEQTCAGLLIAMLVVRTGLCSVTHLGAALLALAGTDGIRFAAHRFWVDAQIPWKGISYCRRIFLDPLTIALWSKARPMVRRDLGLEDATAPKAQSIRRLVRRYYKLLRDCAASAAGKEILAIPGLDDLITATAARIHLYSVPLLATYAKGEIASSSLKETTWCRLLGAKPPKIGAAQQTVGAGEDVPSDGQAQLMESALRGDLASDGLAADLRRATKGPTNQQLSRLAELCQTLTPGTTAWMVTSWLQALATPNPKTGYRPGPSTVHLYRGQVCNRLLTILPPSLDGIAPEELDELYAEIIDSAATTALQAKLRKLVGRFHHFGVERGLLPENQLALPGAGAGHYDVSAHIVAEEEFQQAFSGLGKAYPDKETNERNRAARIFLLLAYRFGLRRAEILGLTLADIRDDERIIVVRKNAVRDVKTRNAERILPMGLLSQEEKKFLRGILERRRAKRNEPLEQQPLFFDSIAAARAGIADHPAPLVAMRELHRVTEEKVLHAHHLRHSFATQHLLGTLVPDLPNGHSDALPHWLRSLGTQEGPKRFHSVCRARVGSLAKRGTMVSMTMGHGADETTYEHYVHGLDALVHAVLANPSRHFRAKRCRTSESSEATEPFGLLPAHAENEWIIWAFGMSPKTRLPIERFMPWFTRCLTNREVRVQQLPQRDSPPGIDSDALLDDALKWKELAETVGKPSTPPARAVALQVLKLIGRLDEPEKEGVRLDLQRAFTFQKAKNDEWLSMTSDEAIQIRANLEPTFAPVLSMQYQGVEWVRGRRKHHFLRQDDVDRWLARPSARVHIRFIRTGNDSPGRRERHARTIFWALKAIQAQLELEHKDREDQKLFPPEIFL